MRAEEEYPHDYRVILILQELIKVMEIKDETMFAMVLAALWNEVLNLIPRQQQLNPKCVVLDTYFAMQGDLRKGLRCYTGKLVDVVGYDEHRSALQRLNHQHEALVKELLSCLKRSN